MKVGKIVFDDTTNYSLVESTLDIRLSELVAIQCKCSCEDSEENDIIALCFKYRYAAKINLELTDTVRYQECIRAEYYELVKLDC